MPTVKELVDSIDKHKARILLNPFRIGAKRKIYRDIIAVSLNEKCGASKALSFLTVISIIENLKCFNKKVKYKPLYKYKNKSIVISIEGELNVSYHELMEMEITNAYGLVSYIIMQAVEDIVEREKGKKVYINYAEYRIVDRVKMTIEMSIFFTPADNLKVK